MLAILSEGMYMSKEKEVKAALLLHLMFMSIGLMFGIVGMMIMILEPEVYEDIEMSKVEAFGAMVMFAGLLMFSIFGGRPQDMIRAIMAKNKAEDGYTVAERVKE